MLSVLDWIEERRENAARIAKTKHGEDRQGWLEDASYFLRAREAIGQLIEASADEHQNVPLRMYIALKILRAWNHGTAGFHAGVVLAVNAWFDGGMKGPVPWPESPFFAEWAQANGLTQIGAYVGFSFNAAFERAATPLLKPEAPLRLWLLMAAVAELYLLRGTLFPRIKRDS